MKLIYFHIVLLILSALFFNACRPKEPNVYKDNKTVQDDFMGSTSCKECHSNSYEAWLNSDHSQSMKPANDSNVLGDFNNITFKHPNGHSFFYKANGKFYVSIEESYKQRDTFEIKYTFGYHPLQQYLVEFPGGKLQCLHTAWDAINKRWYHLYDHTQIDPDEWLNWKHGSMNWNGMCASCHSTNYKKNYHHQSDEFKSTFKEINVACEACHGPARKHVMWYKSQEGDSKKAKLSLASESKQNEQLQYCARCHSRRSELTNEFKHKSHWLNQYDVQVIDTQLYHANGLIKDEVYVWGSFAQSKMHQKGVKCTDCHDPHSYKLKHKGNALCLQCHTSDYDKREHHHHNPGSQGAQCINCHMGGKTYMGIDYRHDHYFHIPRPDLSLKYGVPNNCNSCHENESSAWAAEHTKSWFGKPEVNNMDFTTQLFQDDLTPQGLKEIINQDSLSDILLASAILKWQDFLGLPNFEYPNIYSKHASPIVRRSMATLAGILQSEQAYEDLWLLANDPILSVRLAAFNGLSNWPKEQMSPEQLNQWQLLEGEYLKARMITADFPAGQFNLGQYYHKTGKTQVAERWYRKSIETDYYQNMSRINLAILYSGIGKIDESIGLLNKVIEMEPTFAESYYYLGLLFAEQQRFGEAIKAFAKNIELAPNPDSYYNLGITYNSQKMPTKAEHILIEGHQLFPENHRILYALSFHYYSMKDKSKARKYIQNALQILPGTQSYIQLQRAIEQL